VNATNTDLPCAIKGWLNGPAWSAPPN